MSWEIKQGDAGEVLKALADNSVDAIVTDPPAGIGFMGKAWDGDKGGRLQWIAWLAGILEEARRVLKPGGHALVWAIPRTSHWTATALEDAGFEIRDVITHHFGSGFPKSLNVGKAIDAKAGRLGHCVLDLKRALRERFEACGKTLKQIDQECGFRAANYLRLPFEGKRPDPWVHVLPSREKWEVIKQVIGGGDELDTCFDSAEREIIATKTDAGRRHVAILNTTETEYHVTVAATSEAQRWTGWGTALKPATEHWILARKPLESTVAGNVLKYGTGAINVDACRIAGEVPSVPQPAGGTGDVYGFANGEGRSGEMSQPHEAGRWPANLVLSHGEDCDLPEGCQPGCPVAELDGQAGECASGLMRAGTARINTCGYNGAMPDKTLRDTYGDSGGASRFFYVAKPARGEKDAGLYGMVHRSAGEATGRKEGSAGLNNPRAGAGRTSGGKNFHPTVKPVELMRYLCRLITPPGGLVLDMFAGSGTTGIAALREGFGFIGIEMDTEYAAIARRRIEEDMPLFNRKAI